MTQERISFKICLSLCIVIQHVVLPTYLRKIEDNKVSGNLYLLLNNTIGTAVLQ